MARYTSGQINILLKDYLKKISKVFCIEQALLFGSRARGDYFLDSDVDLILVSSDFASVPFRKRMGLLLAYWEGEVDLEVLAYTPQEFARMKKRQGIVSQAMKEGRGLSV